MDNWVLGLPKKEGKQLERGNGTAAGPQGKDPGQTIPTAINSRFSSSPSTSLAQFLLAALYHTGSKHFTGELWPAVFMTHVHVFLILQLHYQAALGDLIQAVLI